MDRRIKLTELVLENKCTYLEHSAYVIKHHETCIKSEEVAVPFGYTFSICIRNLKYIPRRSPVVARTVQQRSNICFVPPCHVNHQHPWKDREKILNYSWRVIQTSLSFLRRLDAAIIQQASSFDLVTHSWAAALPLAHLSVSRTDVADVLFPFKQIKQRFLRAVLSKRPSYFYGLLYDYSGVRAARWRGSNFFRGWEKTAWWCPMSDFAAVHSPASAAAPGSTGVIVRKTAETNKRTGSKGLNRQACLGDTTALLWLHASVWAVIISSADIIFMRR